MPTVDPRSTFTLNGRKAIVKASDVDDYAGLIVKPHTDYVLRFTINPKGLKKNIANIIHITTGDDCCAYGTRNPSVYFIGETTQLMVIIGNRGNGNNLSLKSKNDLDLDFSSDIEIRVVGTQTTLYINGVKDNILVVGIRTTIKNLKVYLSNPWEDAANAIISNVYFGPV